MTMKTTTIRSFLILQVIMIAGTGAVQAQNKVTAKQVIQTADSLASGTKKDVLVSFFQLAFNKLTGPNKELNFNSNPFAVMLKSNPNLAIDSNYQKYNVLRKLNFGFGLKLDTSYRFNGFSSGIKYALIDRRDSSTSRQLFEGLQQDDLNKEGNALQVKLDERRKTITDSAAKLKFFRETRAFYNGQSFNQLDSGFRAAVKEIVNSQSDFPRIAKLVNSTTDFNLRKLQQKTYDSLKNLIKSGLLWTVGVSDTTYKNQFMFSNILFKTELLKGIGAYKPGSNWEFTSQASLQLLDDTLRKGRDLRRSVLNVEPGFNWVIRNKDNDQSWMVLGFSGSYYHNFGSLYKDEKRDSVTANLTLRVRVISDIWIPLEIKYDPRSGNLFGFLNIRANFTALGKQK